MERLCIRVEKGEEKRGGWKKGVMRTAKVHKTRGRNSLCRKPN